MLWTEILIEIKDLNAVQLSKPLAASVHTNYFVQRTNAAPMLEYLDYGKLADALFFPILVIYVINPIFTQYSATAD